MGAFGFPRRSSTNLKAADDYMGGWVVVGAARLTAPVLATWGGAPAGCADGGLLTAAGSGCGGAGGGPDERTLAMPLSKSNQKGAPSETANAVSSSPTTFEAQSAAVWGSVLQPSGN